MYDRPPDNVHRTFIQCHQPSKRVPAFTFFVLSMFVAYLKLHVSVVFQNGRRVIEAKRASNVLAAEKVVGMMARAGNVRPSVRPSVVGDSAFRWSRA